MIGTFSNYHMINPSMYKFSHIDSFKGINNSEFFINLNNYIIIRSLFILTENREPE